MKKINQQIFFVTLVLGGLFIGIIKGQEARHRWISSKKARNENRRLKTDKQSREVDLDDFEIASFHKN